MLITISKRHAGTLLRVPGHHRIPATAIHAVGRGRAKEVGRDGKCVRFEWSQRDELTRLDSAPERA